MARRNKGGSGWETVLEIPEAKTVQVASHAASVVPQLAVSDRIVAVATAEGLWWRSAKEAPWQHGSPNYRKSPVSSGLGWRLRWLWRLRRHFFLAGTSGSMDNGCTD